MDFLHTRARMSLNLDPHTIAGQINTWTPEWNLGYIFVSTVYITYLYTLIWMLLHAMVTPKIN